jgi:hypothetical protein
LSGASSILHRPRRWRVNVKQLAFVALVLVPLALAPLAERLVLLASAPVEPALLVPEQVLLASAPASALALTVSVQVVELAQVVLLVVVLVALVPLKLSPPLYKNSRLIITKIIRRKQEGF